MSRLSRFMSRKSRNHGNELSPDERQAQFLREHDARMRKVDDALDDLKRTKERQPAAPAGAEKPASA